MIWSIIIGGIAGWLAGRIMKGKGYGILANILIGVVGGWLGFFVLGLIGLRSDGGLIGSLVVSVIGAVILIWLVRQIRKA